MVGRCCLKYRHNSGEYMSDIFNYLDYRRFLKDRFFELKAAKQSFSYRNFNRKAGFSSSGYLKLVMDGKRNLAPEGTFKVCRGLGFSREEARYFENLVKMDQATSHEEKDYYFKEMTKVQPSRPAKEILQSQYRMFSHWYYVALLELVRLADFREDPRWISKKMSPRVAPDKIRKALDELITLGCLKRDENGRLVRTDNMISTPDEVRSISLVNFSHQMLDIAKKALDEAPAAERDFSTLTLGLSEEGFKKLKTMVQQFRKCVHGNLESGEDDKTVVAHLNIQLFKLTKGGST